MELQDALDISCASVALFYKMFWCRGGEEQHRETILYGNSQISPYLLVLMSRPLRRQVHDYEAQSPCKLCCSCAVHMLLSCQLCCRAVEFTPVRLQISHG